MHWGGLDLARVDHAAIADEMASAVAAMFSARLRIYRPGVAPADSPYDPVKDQGGVGAPVLVWDTTDSGASVTPRSAHTAEFGGQTAAMQEVELQILRAPIVIRPGYLIRVVNGGNAQALARQVLVVTEASDTSAAWTHIIHARVTLSTLLPGDDDNTTPQLPPVPEPEYDIIPDPENPGYFIMVQTNG